MATHVIVGAQYGSEAKGHITHRVLRNWTSKQDGRLNIRVAGPNAGHTVYDDAGNKFALRQVPVGAVTQGVTLAIAAGSEVDPDVLVSEINTLRAHGHAPLVYIDPEVTIIEDRHKEAETTQFQPGIAGPVEGSDLISRIGSTGKGIGAARADRIMRRALRLVDDISLMARLQRAGNVLVRDVATLARSWQDAGGDIVIEGTQGYGLGLRSGNYPYVTSSDCRAVDFLAMAGYLPVEKPTVWAVARMFPIRVAGNSGPLRGETTWAALGLPEERTTVTQKVRRVGEWDGGLVARAVAANGHIPAGFGRHGADVRIALTMTDQKWPALAGVNDLRDLTDKITYDPDLGLEVYGFLGQIKAVTGVHVQTITTGPETGVDL